MINYLLKFSLFIVLLCLALAVNAQDKLWSAVGGSSHWMINARSMEMLGLSIDSGSKVTSDGQDKLLMTLPLSRTGSMEFDGSFGRFNKLQHGSLLIEGGVILRGSQGLVDLRGLRLTPLEGTRDAALVARLADGEAALTLRYGHFSYEPGNEILKAQIMDAYVGPALARVIGGDGALGQYLGQVSLALEVVAPPSGSESVKGTACGTSPNWPTLAGFDANLQMQAIDQILETSTPTIRAAGRVAITPSAFFRNIGNADIPWYSMFTVPSADNIVGNEAPDQADDPDCIDNGSGQCEPYGVDQGGLLVWNIYRLKDGLLEQLGRSAVKHAWNSINGDCACRGGRVVGAGCTDLYGVGNNSDRDVLGPRSEIQAAPVLWNRVGSIWDNNSDGRCDELNTRGIPHDGSWCRNTPTDDFDRRLTVLETDLDDQDARYFLEAWYLVRQDVDVFDSMGFQEIVPTFDPAVGASGVWRFPCAGGLCNTTFVNGPVLNQLVNNAAPPAGATSATRDDAQGRVRLTSQVTALPGGRFRYQYSLMNVDFDRAIDGVSIPLQALSAVDNLYISDGDGTASNDWSISSDADSVDFNAPTSGILRWGSLVSFGFDADASAQQQPGVLSVNAPGIPASFPLEVNAPTGAPSLVFADGFETP